MGDVINITKFQGEERQLKRQLKDAESAARRGRPALNIPRLKADGHNYASKLQRAANDYEAHVRELQSQLQRLKGAKLQQERQDSRQSSKSGKSANELNNLRGQISDSEGQISQAVAQETRLKKEIKALGSKLRKLEGDLSRYERERGAANRLKENALRKAGILEQKVKQEETLAKAGSSHGGSYDGQIADVERAIGDAKKNQPTIEKLLNESQRLESNINQIAA